MSERPLIIFPSAELVEKPRGRGGKYKPPAAPTNTTKQSERIEQQFSDVMSAFISDEPGDIERVLVMETSNRIKDLQMAVANVQGLEWLAEMDVDDIDLHDLYDEEAGKKIKGGRFYLLSSNKQATERLLGLWKKHKNNGKLDIGKFKDIFTHLITLRLWDTRDRLRDTGILDAWRKEWHLYASMPSSFVKFELELHYKKSENDRNKNEQEISRTFHTFGGRINQRTCITDIAFHALKAELPINAIKEVVQHDWDTEPSIDNFLPIFKIKSVKYFRPFGQHTSMGRELPNRPEKRTFPPIEDKSPVIALLDGAPILRHEFLRDRISIYDPENYIESYEPSQQKHGTAMASLICHGDLCLDRTDSKSLIRPIYVRPVMKPHPVLSNCEEIPSEFFQEDIIERAVRNMFEGEYPSAPDIKVINLSLGNYGQHYLHEMSPWAKLLDWLSFKYKVLFIVSSGNYFEDIKIEDPASNAMNPNFRQLSFDEEKKSIIKAIDKNQRNHRLLSPAESVNALTVGALQSDSFSKLNDTQSFDSITNKTLPAPYSRIGPGYLGSIKPDIFTQGGLLLYDKNPNDQNCFNPVINNNPPGVQTAYPGTRTEQLNNTAYEAGTSNAAASHGAGHIFEMLDELRGEHVDILSPDFDAVLIKTLLVHSASYGENSNEYEHLRNSTNSRGFKRYLSRFLGYGTINFEKVLECTKNRATAIGCGHIQKQQRHRFIFPLPIGSSIQSYLRLTVTLAWLTPINPRHVSLRRAKLFFENNRLTSAKKYKRQESDWHQVRKGTVQHEIFELNKDDFQGDSLDIFVQCAAGAGTLDDEIPYGLAVTLEIAEQEALDLYQVVRENIRQKVRPSSG